jgi:DNA polymerase III epsilon subunit-like protein
MVFDTETTGLPPRNAEIIKTVSWPHIVQFSYIIYDTDKKCIINIEDSIVKVSNDVNISAESTLIHGITREITQSNGIELHYILDTFMKDVQDIDMFVCHNIDFDINMVLVELTRMSNQHDTNENELYNQYKSKIENIKQDIGFCTMKRTTNMCNLKRKGRYGKEYNKYPSLIELHQYIFKESPKNLHNSLNDVIVCLRCFYKLKFMDDLYEVDPEFKIRMDRLL